jgi:undecaprenyl diphosphate synthase
LNKVPIIPDGGSRGRRLYFQGDLNMPDCRDREMDSQAMELTPENLPRHVAIIMDGNGRWAQAKGMPRLEGHRVGVESVRVVIKAARKFGLKYLTLYTFSEENWQRPRPEVEGLMRLLNRHLKAEIKELHANGVRINALGELTRLPKASQKLLREAMAETSANDELVLSLCLSYGGRQEILQACRELARECRDGALDPEEIEDELFSSRLFSRGLPDPDLVIRTGGDQRISNFLLWQIAYSELYITPTYWPDFREGELLAALLDYQRRQRRYGKTGEQIRQGS